MEPDVVDTWAGRGTGPQSSRTNGLQRYSFGNKIDYNVCVLYLRTERQSKNTHPCELKVCVLICSKQSLLDLFFSSIFACDIATKLNCKN